MNPFVIKGYKGAKYFCNRKKESDILIDAIKNSQDITLYAYRRLGKSALIQHVFNKIDKEYCCIYVDIWGTTKVQEFIRELANGVMKSDYFSKRNLTSKVLSFMKSIGASFSFGMDGLPKIDLIFNDKTQVFKNLEEIFSFLNKSDKSIVVAIDEFQEIKKYENEIPFEGKLRALVQQSKNITFLFSGSEHHLLTEIFNKYNKPFYQSTRMIAIDKIDKQDYREFIIHHFKTAKKQIEPTIVDFILEITHMHTYYIQAISNFLYSQYTLPHNIDEFNNIYREYISEKRVFYSELPERLTKQQFAAVKSFAMLGKVASPTSGEFLERTTIKSASSMQRVISSLLNKQIIIKDEGNYRLYDVFCEHFLKYT